MIKKIIAGIIILLIAIQFIPVDKTNPLADPENDFIFINNPPSDIGNILKNACYDCHSNHTRYPWYSEIAPASWLIKEHVNNGRNHLNLSVWNDYKERKKDHKIAECIDMIKSGEMPMKGYVMFHSEAEISHEQKMQLINWFNELRDSLR